MRFASLLASLFSLLFIASCTTDRPSTNGTELALSHASLLQIEQADSFTWVRIADPWHSGKTLHSYVLVNREQPLPTHRPEGTLVRTPLERMVVTTSVHTGLLLEIGAGSRLVGVTDTAYIVSPEVKRYLATHPSVQNMGASMTPDVEKMRAAQTDAVLVSPFENADYGALSHTNIPLIECADYMETSPLGRAEWMRFYGRLVGKAAYADSLFGKVEKQYLTQKEAIAKKKIKRPSVMCDLRTGGTWYQPGGASTMGQLIADAGGSYLWADRKESGSLALDLESVFAKAHQADIWIIKYGQPTPLTYAQLQHDCAQYAQFAAWKQHHIFACNTLFTPFYEETPFHPERLLQNLSAVFGTSDDSLSSAASYYVPLQR